MKKQMKENFKKRPLSWSQINNFKYNKEKWYEKYVLGIEEKTNTPEQEFGKIFAKSCEDRKPIAPVTLYSEVEYPIEATIFDIPMVGYIDTYEPMKAFIDHKTGVKEWTYKRVREHGQLKMYALMLFLMFKVKPENLKIALEWVETKKENDVISFVEPVQVKHFDVDITMRDIMDFGLEIKDIVEDMDKYIKKHEW